MVFTGRTVSYSSSNRAGSLSGVHYDDGLVVVEPSVHSHRVHSVSSPRVRHEHIDLSSARQPDSKFYNDVNARLAALGPEPLPITSHYVASHQSATPLLTNIPNVHSHSHHHHRSHRAPVGHQESVVRHRTLSSAPHRSDYDAEVAAYLAYTPSRHVFSSHRFL